MHVAGAARGQSPGSAWYRRDTDALGSYSGPPRDSGCWGPVLRSGPSREATGRGPDPASRSHVLSQSSVGTSLCAWQHHRPSGLAVLHLEFELKPYSYCQDSMSSYRLPILTYHSLDSSGSVVSTSPSSFRRQIQWLDRQGFQTLSLAEAVRLMRAGQPFRERTCVVTFDDGYESVYRVAFPVLQEFGFTATVFLITGYCGKWNSWPGHVSPVGEQSLLSWTQIEEMARFHIEFGSHTVTHPDLACLTRQEAEREMRESKQMIQERLGRKVEVFAYPYGKYAPWTVELVKEHFTGACSTILGKATLRDDPALIPRVDMYYLSSQWLIESLDTRGMDWYLGLRQAFRVTKELFV